MWGGTGIPYSEKARIQYLRSCASFAKVTEEMGVDAEICTHPFVDKSIERLALIRDIPDGVPNPFVLGTAGYKQYEKMFTEMCLDRMAERAGRIDQLLPPDPRIGSGAK